MTQTVYILSQEDNHTKKSWEDMGIEAFFSPLSFHSQIEDASLSGEYSALMFTSKNGVRYGNKLGLDNDFPAFCVGNRTQQECIDMGYTNCISIDGSAKDLEKHIQNMPHRFLYPCALHTSHEFLMPNIIRVPVYETHFIDSTPTNLSNAIKVSRYTDICVMSVKNGETINGLLSQNQKNACRFWCMSPEIAKTITNATGVYTSRTPSMAGVIDAYVKNQ